MRQTYLVRLTPGLIVLNDERFSEIMAYELGNLARCSSRAYIRCYLFDLSDLSSRL